MSDGAIVNRPWFSRGESRKSVRNRQHFAHLVSEYLPSHTGLT